MSHGGLPPRRVDQHQEPTPRAAVPGARTVAVVGKPGAPLVIQQGGVPNMKSAEILQQNPGTGTFGPVFTNNVLIWAVHLSYAIATDGSYPAGTIAQFYARIRINAGAALAVVELAISNSSSNANGDADPGFPGLPVNSGGQLAFDVNNNVGVPHVNQRISAIVWYSTH